LAQPTKMTRRLAQRIAAPVFAAVAGLATAMPAPGAIAADDPLLASLVGDWIGRGKAKISPNAAEELVYCKVNNRLVDGGATLEQKGRCAIASNSGALKGTIKSQGNGKYAGSLTSVSSQGPAKVSGTGKSGRLVLTADFTDRKTKRPSQAKITVVAGDGKYRLVSELLDQNGNTQYVTSDIVFAPN
jgi:hypothetical protein